MLKCKHCGRHYGHAVECPVSPVTGSKIAWAWIDNAYSLNTKDREWLKSLKVSWL
jgi:hypothetical protein